jgi:SAM-dependent methyltransferase
MISEALKRRFYPDDSRDGTVRFYRKVRAHLTSESVVLNLGAGPPTGNPLRVLKGECRRVVGADVDPIVLQNDELDEGHVIDGTLPFDDDSYDLVLSDFVLEHVEDPDAFMSEVHRVLRRGGHFFFRTPNRFHYVATISSLTPHWFHAMVANRVRGLDADAHEPWPTHYRLNTRRALVRVARSVGFSETRLCLNESEPSYLVFHPVPFVLGVAYERLVNRFSALDVLRGGIFGHFMK